MMDARNSTTDLSHRSSCVSTSSIRYSWTPASTSRHMASVAHMPNRIDTDAETAVLSCAPAPPSPPIVPTLRRSSMAFFFAPSASAPPASASCSANASTNSRSVTAMSPLTRCDATNDDSRTRFSITARRTSKPTFLSCFFRILSNASYVLVLVSASVARHGRAAGARTSFSAA